MRYCFSIIIGLCLLGLCSPGAAFARISGSLAWDYAEYNAKEAGADVVDASSFAQRYSLMFDKDGQFMDGRGGDYHFSLGGEWFSVDTETDLRGVQSELNVERAKLLYRGDILFAPGGLPIRFHAYGRDIKRTGLESNTIYTQGSFDDNYIKQAKSVLTPKIAGDISDGQSAEYGASLILGIKNGSYLGRYRDILSHLPKLYVDYHEMFIRDLESASPQKFRDKELAFVSLNKKHNWFHYRFYEHRDYINPAEDYYERTYLLGTVDQNLRREWVNLTNWIQLSADASYVSEVNPRNSMQDERTYAINAFAKTHRSNWQSTTLSRFWRYEAPDDLERVLEVPVYSSGDVDRDNGWYLSFVGRHEMHNRPFALINSESTKDDVYTKGRWETNRGRPYALASHVAVESKFDDSGKGRAIKTGVEYFSSKNNKGPYSLYSDIIAGYYWGEKSASLGSEGDFFEVSGRFDLAKKLSSRARAGVESKFLVGTGDIDGLNLDHVTPELSVALPTATENMNVYVDGAAWRGKIGGYYEHYSLERMRNRFDVTIDHVNQGAGGDTQAILRHRLDQQNALYNYNVTTEFVFGDSINAYVNSQAFGVILGSTAYTGWALSNNAKLFITPNRSHRFGVQERCAWISQDGEDDGYRIGLTQNYAYTKYVYFGLARKQFELKEYFDYEILVPNSIDQYQAVSLTGVADYYPLRWMRLGSRLRWNRDLEAASDDVGVGLYSNLDFALLDVTLEYEYGMRTIGDNGVPLDRDEQSWKISISKTF